MEPVYIETNCTFEHGGRTFEAGGAYVTPDRVIAYPGRDETSRIDPRGEATSGPLKDWHGNKIGTWKAVLSWPTPRSYMASRMFQIEAVVNGITYTGRGCGEGMIYKGKRKAGRK